MSDQPPWNPHYGPAPISDDFNLDGSQGSFAFPYQSGTVPPSAPGDVLAPSYDPPIPHSCHSSATGGTTEPISFDKPSALASAHLTGLAMHSNPTSTLDNTWGSSGLQPISSQFQASGVHHTPSAFSISSSWASHALAQAASLAPHQGQAWGVPSNPMQILQQSYVQPGITRPPPRQRSLFRRLQPMKFRISSSQDSEACWRCKDCHKKCIPGTPCHRCRTSPGSSSIPCRRGPVCDTEGLPLLCHLSPQQPQSTTGQEQLPDTLIAAFGVLDGARQRRERAIARVKNHDDARAPIEQPHSILVRVVTIKVENIRSCYQPLAELDIFKITELPYDKLIIKIVWELEDNPGGSRLAGITSVKDLVGLLEAASLCETANGHQDRNRRLVYSSMLCLFHCMEALRLSSQGLLIPEPHSHCAQSNECMFPALRNLSRYVPRYAEALNKELFHKHRGRHNSWLLIFYSLCIQCHVRRALMALEERQQPQFGLPTAAEPQIARRPLDTASYLLDAVNLFRHISLQNRGKLANQIRNSRAQPSVYLQPTQQPHSTRAGSSGRSSRNSWEIWHEEGVTEYLGRIFDITTTNSTNHPHPHMHRQAEAPDTGEADSDSDVTITGSPTATITTAPAAMVQVTAVSNTSSNSSNLVGMEMDYCPTISSSSRLPGHTPTPVPSIWSVTSFGDESSASTWSATPSFPSNASSAGSETPSMLSVSTAMLDDDSAFELDGNTFEPNDSTFGFDGFGAQGNGQ